MSDLCALESQMRYYSYGCASLGSCESSEAALETLIIERSELWRKGTCIRMEEKVERFHLIIGDGERTRWLEAVKMVGLVKYST